jgi:hypothetical protein
MYSFKTQREEATEKPTKTNQNPLWKLERGRVPLAYCSDILRWAPTLV